MTPTDVSLEANGMDRVLVDVTVGGTDAGAEPTRMNLQRVTAINAGFMSSVIIANPRETTTRTYSFNFSL